MKITNKDRTSFIVFAVWCRKHNLDVNTQEYSNWFQSVTDEEWTACYHVALYCIIKDGKCPSCWGTLGTMVWGEKNTVSCTCGKEYKLNYNNNVAEEVV